MSAGIRAAAHLTVVDLFAGAGGLSFGFRKAGFRNLWAVDHCAAAVETFRRNVAGKAACADIQANIQCPPAAIIVGRPPCQGFSSAGRRKADDPRNACVSVFAQIVARTKPVAFVFENVEGFLTCEQGQRVRELLEPLIAAGYRIHLRKVNAANFGVPQNRKRVLVIGGLGFDPTFPQPTHWTFGVPGARSALSGLARASTVAEALGNLPDPAERPPGNPADHWCSPLSERRWGMLKTLEPGQTMRDLAPAYRHPSYQRRARRRVRDGMPTARRGGAPAGLRRLRPDEPSKAITGGAGSEFIHPSADRFLTLRECARLQTFPDEFVFCGTKTEKSLLIGNAMPPLWAEAIAKSLARDLQRDRNMAQSGVLLSFMAGTSKGVSPALRRVTDMIASNFQLSTQQLGLF